MTGRKKCVVAMAPYERPWSNVELVKDCGLIPYLLYKNHNCEVHMVGAKGIDYSYKELIQGVSLDFLENGKNETKMAYIKEHAREIDLLLLRGCYVSNFGVASVYKQENPKGKIYVGLDANSFWMDKVDWRQGRLAEFLDCCDVIATSGKEVQNYLNQKWPWKISYVPNGYYDFSGKRKPPVYAEKENVILTVGRLGTTQKATHVLLEAFAMISEKVPEWKLRLVGTIEDSFQSYIEEYFKKYPQLQNRVDFAGAILDREALFEEYRKAKIFAMTSEIEGGTPNVIAEALNGGCVVAVTAIDGAVDATDYEKCGEISDIDDPVAFAKNLLELIEGERLQEFSDYAYEYGRTHFDMENIVAKLYERLWGRNS